VLQNKNIELYNWLIKSEFQLPKIDSNQLILYEIKKIDKDYKNNSKFLNLISQIIHIFANKLIDKIIKKR